MTDSDRPEQRHWRYTLIVLLLPLSLALAGCLSDDESTPEQPTPSPTSQPAQSTETTTSPSEPPARAATASPTASPTTTATASPTLEPSATPTPDASPVPAGQEEDLPNVTLTYAIDARLRDVESGIVDAQSVVTITSQESAPLDRLFFRIAPAQFNEFSLNRLSREGIEVDSIATDNGTTLEIPLEPPLAPSDTTQLAFDFVVPLRDTGDGFASITRDGEVMRLGVWYPMLSNDDGYPPLLDPPYTLAADYSVSFTAPAEVVVAASGELTAPPQNTDAGIRYDYTLENGRDFALMLSTAYAVDERMTASGIVVRQYTLASEYGTSDDERASIRDQAFATAERALAEFSANIGPYPWPSLALVEAGPGLGGGIEYSALTIISYDSGALDNLVAHETAHMWFYGIIGTRTQADPWLDEGAATFLGNGIDRGDYTISSDRGANIYIAPLGASIEELAMHGGDWVTAVYTQGGSFYSDMLIEMGDDAFWAAMQEIYTTQQFGIATPWEVLTSFAAHTDSDLSAIYARYFSYEWLGEVE